MKNNKNMPIGEILIQHKLITQQQLVYALKVQKLKGKKLGDMLIELGYVQEEDLINALSKRLNVPYVDLTKFKVQTKTLDLLTRNYVEKNNIIPIENNDRMIVVATNDPMNFYLMDDIILRTGHNVKFVLATKTMIEMAIDQYYGDDSSKIKSDINENFKMEKLSLLDLDEQLKSDIESAPIVKFVNSLILNAVSSNVSDIHIEPRKSDIRVRNRIDGQLIEDMIIDIKAHNNIVTRIKIMAKMDIAEKRMPQDGRIELTEKEMSIDMRVSTIPTIFGEKIVIRILGGMSNLLSNRRVNFNARNVEVFNKIIKSPSGIILVCGPTGSGKTTTLYSVLKEVNESTVNIITIEDPVEYKIDGISQIQVNNKTGLTFAKGLRSILRQDPDIIMLGEIRDTETAEIAIKSAITGHLVLSTIHTNSAVATIPRLIDMGIEPFLLSAGLVGIISQRLIKRLCPKCKYEYVSTKDEMEYLCIKNPIKLYKSIGCGECTQTGYKGRMAIYEMLPVTQTFKKQIIENPVESDMEELAISEGMVTLKEDGKRHVINGITSIDELMQVTYSL